MSKKKIKKLFRSPKLLIKFSALFLLVFFPIYIAFLYQELKTGFNRNVENKAMRIYSDVTRINASQNRAFIENRLKSLGYSFNKSSTALNFTLRPMRYPDFLVAPAEQINSSPTFLAQDKTVTIKFDAEGPESLVQAIQVEGQEIPELYLEPELIATLAAEGAPPELRQLLKFEEIPANLWKAIIAVEDQHFLEHKGLDPRGFARAILINLKTRSLAQGGSTITQQLVKNLSERHNKNIIRKFNELFLAVLLELKFSKEQILERYLNEVYLGQVGNLEVHGVSEGAKLFFDKDAAELNLAESALLAGLIRGPGYYSPYRAWDRAVARQHWVLKRMVETQQISEIEAKEAIEQTIQLAPQKSASNKAPYFVDYVKAQLFEQLKPILNESEITTSGLTIYTTLDPSLSTLAQASVSKGLAQLEKQFPLPNTLRLEGALATVEPKTGYIRALIGGKNYSESNFNRILNMKRPVGSIFKPFVFLSAFEKGRSPNGTEYSAGYPLDDSPVTWIYNRGKQKWSPRNYEKEHLGWITMRTALSQSINTATARLAADIGLPSIIETARRLGIESKLIEVPSIALGSAELSPIEVLTAYATLANEGERDHLTVIRAVLQEEETGRNKVLAQFYVNPKRYLERAPVDLLNSLLQSVFEDGTAKTASQWGWSRPSAGKTGTTNDYRDSWFAGFTPNLVTVVWVGLDQYPKDPKQLPKKWKLTGATAALPIWTDFMSVASENLPLLNFPESTELIDAKIDEKTGKAPSFFCLGSRVIVEKAMSAFPPSGSSCESKWPNSVAEIRPEVKKDK